MNTYQRIQEKLADRLSFVQYPQLRPADATTREASRTGWRFNTPMSIGKRIDLALLSILLLILGTVSLGAVVLAVFLLL